MLINREEEEGNKRLNSSSSSSNSDTFDPFGFTSNQKKPSSCQKFLIVDLNG